MRPGAQHVGGNDWSHAAFLEEVGSLIAHDGHDLAFVGSGFILEMLGALRDGA